MMALPGLFCFIALAAQPIPDDPDFRTGKLESGLTYYLCHNDVPAGCAEFYIAHNVGALQEEDNQDGLAHFLEHMAFNGTRHYPDKGILDFLAKEGVRFGYNVNAYTSKTETVYNLSEVPLVRESFVDSVLMVLHDWSCDISCEQKALDEERGVISEEWRLSDDPRSRMARLQNALVFHGSKQARRSVLGSLEVINGFRRDEILDFYHKWYRPDLQAIIVVGDFDVDRMEGRVRELFSDIPASVNPEPKDEYDPPALTEPLFSDMTDPEIRYQAFKALYRQKPESCNHRDESFYKDYLCRMIVSSVMADRLKERAKEKGSPAQSATMVTNTYRPDIYVSMATVVPSGKDNLEGCLRFTEREVRRLLLYGISEAEFEAAKLGVSERMHLNSLTERSETRNSEIVDMVLASFLQGAPLVLPGTMNEIRRSILDALTPDDIAPYPKMMFGEADKIYSNCYNHVSDKGIAPSAERMKEVIAEVASENIPPRNLVYPSLDLEVAATPGAVKSVSKVKGTDMELWKLSNGIRLFYKEAAPVGRGDRLCMSFLFDTGYKAFDPQVVTASRYALAHVKRMAGFRGCTRPEMKNYPALSGVKLTLGGGPRGARIDVSARPGKVENAFKAAYLQVTDPFLGDERTLSLQKASSLKSLGKKKTPKNLFDEDCRVATYGKHPWMSEIDSADVEMVDLAMAEDVFRRFYGDVSSMKVVICSDLPRAEILSLVEKYIASLEVPYPYRKGKYLPKAPVVKGRADVVRTSTPLSAPFTEISWNHYFKARGGIRERAAADILDYIMSARYLSLIREERGGAYSVSFFTVFEGEKGIPSRSFVDFRTRPVMRDLLLGDLQDELERMCADGPTPQEMDFAVKYLVKHYYEKEDKVARSLAMQLGRMVDRVETGIPYGYDYEKVVTSLQPSDIRDLARRISSGDLLLTVYNEE